MLNKFAVAIVVFLLVGCGGKPVPSDVEEVVCPPQPVTHSCSRFTDRHKSWPVTVENMSPAEKDVFYAELRSAFVCQLMQNDAWNHSWKSCAKARK